MSKWLQSNAMKSQRKIICKTTIEISYNLQTRMIPLFGKVNRPTLHQMPSTTLPQQMLQNSAMGKLSNHTVGTCLLLITSQDI